MLDIGFSEILVIFVLALIVLGPEKLPRVVREVGRWVGRARAMARQFQEQLEDEVDSDRNRTIRQQSVRAVGGVPPADSSPLTSEFTDLSATSEQTTSEATTSDTTAASGDRPSEPLTPDAHERGT